MLRSLPQVSRLSDFGIVPFAGSDGQEQWSISLNAADASQLGGSRLIFNAVTKSWNLDRSNLLETSSSSNVRDPSLEQEVTTRPNPPSSRRGQHSPWYRSLGNTEHIDFFRNVDWSSSPLGPLQSWPLLLQSFVTFMMGDTNAAAIYWGSELTAIYNLGMLELSSARLQKNRDMIMGRSFVEIWSELWAQMEPVLDTVRETRVPADSIDIDLYPLRDGHAEETFWTASFMAIQAPDGEFLGYYNRGREVTKEIIAERRTKTLTEIASSSDLEGDLIWNHLFDAFRANERDFPMAFAYQATEDPVAGTYKLEMKQSIGLPASGHDLVPEVCDLYRNQNGFFPLYRRAKSSDKPLVLRQADGSLPDHLLSGFEWRGFGEPSRGIAVIAIRSSDRMLGILVVGLNPRRPYDVEYEGFLNSLSRHASATVINAIDREEAKLRGERLAKQLAKSEAQIRDMALYGPVGMLRIAPNGKITWANDQFYEMTGHGRDEEDQYELSFVDVVALDDQERSAAYWVKVIERRETISVSLRLIKTWVPPTSSPDVEETNEPVWVNAQAYPIIEEDEVIGVAAAISDISYLKWAEATQSRSAAAAKEAKRLQENFIDIVSHEMRNPLSAITQLADEIASSWEMMPPDFDPKIAHDIVKSNVSSAQTILLCAAHQKRIVDDVLTLSKLEAMMLSITPVVVQPAKVVETVVRMFDGEVATHKIQFSNVVDESFTRYNIDWVCMDPSRLTQILINLIGNAIKFTKTERKRLIKVRLSVALSRPSDLSGVQWYPTQKKQRDPTQAPDWGEGEPLYLCFEVEDTGRGLEKEEMSKLFNKFQQATAKTHIKYGGSGLGLFISRELTETQGGEIGVDSKPGQGSIFAFYIKGRRAEPPVEPTKVVPPPLPMRIAEVSTPDTEAMRTPQIVSDVQNRQQRSLNVLVVEDNVVNAQVLTRQLEKAHVKVYLANHGVEALEFLKSTRSWRGVAAAVATADQPSDPAIDLDFVLMDVEMPVMDGLTCTRKIRELEADGCLEGHMKIIAITANARQEQIDRVLQAGMDDVMPKPFRVKELLVRMEEVVAAAQMSGGRESVL